MRELVYVPFKSVFDNVKEEPGLQEKENKNKELMEALAAEAAMAEGEAEIMMEQDLPQGGVGL